MAANSDYLVSINKAPCDVGHIYAKINKEAMFEAMKNLNGSEFFLWTFCASQSERLGNFEFGPAGVKKEIGLSESTFKVAKKGLLAKGYLVKQGNKLRFYEIPQVISEEDNFQLLEQKAKNQTNAQKDNFQPVAEQDNFQPNAQEAKFQTFRYVGSSGEEFVF